MSSLYMQFGGDKIWNHVLYLTPLIALEMSYKEGAVINTVFCPPMIWVPDLEKSKNIIFSPRASRTSRMTWHNLFGHQSTQSAFFNQNDQNAPSQP